jgi:O-antigen/teichoic acid export membrane protein
MAVVSPSLRGGPLSVLADGVEIVCLKLAAAPLGLLAGILLSRGLGPAGRGSYHLPLVASATLVALSRCGLDHVGVFLIGTQRLPEARVAGQNGLVAAGAGLSAAAALPLIGIFLPLLVPGAPTSLLLLAGLTIPFSLHAQFSASLLTLVGEVRWQFRVSAVVGAAHVVMLGALFLMDALHPLTAMAVYLTTVVLSWLLMTRPLAARGLPWLRWDISLLRETLRQSLWLHVAMVIYFLHYRVDTFLVQGLAGTAELGLYSLAVSLAETILLGSEALAVAILPRQVSNTLRESAALSLRAARLSGLSALGAGCLLAVGGSPLIRLLFGPAFLPAYAPLLVLLPGVVFLSMERMCGGPTIRTGQPGRIAATYAAALGCNVALNLWLIPRWGIQGAAFASSLSYAFEALLILVWVARLGETSLVAALRPRREDLAQFLAVLQQSRRLLTAWRQTGSAM